MPRVLTLDAAFATCSAGLVENGRVVAERQGGADQAASLADLVASLLAGAAVDSVAVVVGPGSFTGLRAAIALAHGIGIAGAIPVLGVTVGAALRDGVPPGRALWTAIDNKRGGLFLERDGAITTIDPAALPVAAGQLAVAGDAAIAVVSRLAARGVDVQLLSARRPAALGIARAVERGDTRPAVPLYVDPPQARPGPAGRPPPM